MSSSKHKKFSIKDHPFLKEAQQQNEAKLSEFLERISGSKLSIQEKKVKKDIEQSKSTFVKIDKGVEVRVHDQPRKFMPKIVDLNETKKEKKAEKIVRKEVEKQQGAAAASGVAAASERIEREPQKERFKDKHQRRMKEYRDEVDEERLDDYYDDQDQDDYEDELDPEARKELNNMLGRYRSSTYRDRDREEIIESKPGDIEREENYSKMMAMKEDMEQERLLKEQRQKKKRKKMRRLEQVDEERSYSDDD